MVVAGPSSQTQHTAAPGAVSTGTMVQQGVEQGTEEKGHERQEQGQQEQEEAKPEDWCADAREDETVQSRECDDLIAFTD